ncbi:MAG: hypothetical protein KKE23_02870 [Nanoarchaeota archaeon]|nr:hypothetical protein [Nanoarchaeota archaeon]
MYIRLKRGIQKRLIQQAIDFAGSQKRLSDIMGIPAQNIFNYLNRKLMPENRFDKLVKILKIKNKNDLIIEKLPDNWRQIIGGKNCVISKKRKGTFLRDMKVIQATQSIRLKKWHASMKRDSPEKYYLLQYSRFKKVGNYKLKTLKGEKVRNALEKETADFLFKRKIDYQYEPLIKIGDKVFFPDFLIYNRYIVECTAWRGFDKAIKLKDKIKVLKKKYQVFVIIPKALNKYYQILNNHLILGLDEFAPIAQSFLEKSKKGATGRATDC